ncbi:hypothetical protein B0O80DRAFT_160747 [Mortierella sp. GBAus27b]|nr:hypothetical protein B0O80DRAFT_160747 [Mortierella sp. GBAus27b]
MNRKNPETQRWQFYHPHFQRDFPQLRKNIKRKSARSMNTAPATSRVIFEHGKGYFLQRNDRSRSNSGETSHSQALSHIRPSEMRPTPPTPSPSSQIQPISPHLQRQSPPVPRHATQSSPTISSGPASSHEQRDRPHMPYPSDSTRPGAYQRQSYDGNADSSHDASFARPPPPPSPFIGSDAQGYRSNRTISGNGYNGPESSRDGPARHFSVIDHRKSSTQSGGSDHSSPLVRPQEAPSHPSRSHGSMTESFHDSHRTADRPHSMGERGPVPKDASQPTPTLPAGNKFNTPPTPAIPSPSSASSSFPPTGHSQQQPQQPGRAIGSPKSPQHADRFSPLNAKELESRLHFVEDAYMALRQYAQKLEQVQASQDRSLQWMREKIDQLTDAAQMRRDSVASPLTPQSGVISTTKRKADPIPDDPRSRSRFDTSAPSSSSRHDSTDIPMGEHRESYYTHSHHPSRGSGVFEGSSSSSGYHHSSSDPHYHDGPAAAHHHHHPSATHLHPSSSHHPHSQSQGLQSHQYRPPTTQGKVY